MMISSLFSPSSIALPDTSCPASSAFCAGSHASERILVLASILVPSLVFPCIFGYSEAAYEESMLRPRPSTRSLLWRMSKVTAGSDERYFEYCGE